MGKVNNVLNRYFRDRERFADLFNGVFFDGRQAICAEGLSEISEVCIGPGNRKGKDHRLGNDLERIRDIRMQLESGEILRVLALENQNLVDYAMPFRCMQYDAMEYGRQLADIRRRNEKEGCYANAAERLCRVTRNDRLIPVYTLCLYHGEESWDGPRSLKDMMDFGMDGDGMSSFFADYPFHLYCVNEEKKFEIFKTEVRVLFEMLCYRRDKAELKRLVESGEGYRHVSGETLEAAAVMLNAPRLWENRMRYMNQEQWEEYDMCQAMREWAEEERSIGREEGMEKGMEITLYTLVKEGLLKLRDAAGYINMEEDAFAERMKQAGF
ncbi:MAG: Rpn family recombination-promoting nuclease/putative transposase [Lachnospiraceae bacterium]|nr:Rpn family recombination-promoting nuclease/putative transposase [Lachnospiraceae bacterium]